MNAISVLDSEALAAAKQASRDDDVRRLVEGAVSFAELKLENRSFAALPLHQFVVIAVGGQPVRHPQRGHSERN